MADFELSLGSVFQFLHVLIKIVEACLWWLLANMSTMVLQVNSIIGIESVASLMIFSDIHIIEKFRSFINSRINMFVPFQIVTNKNTQKLDRFIRDTVDQ